MSKLKQKVKKVFQRNSGNDSVKVIVRLRPCNSTENGLNNDPKWKGLINDDKFKLRPKDNKLKDHIKTKSTREDRGKVSFIQGNKEYYFDRILDTNTTQDEAFDVVAKHVCDDLLEGYNGTVFVYGQSGSGKTYTMYGPENESMIIKSDDIKDDNATSRYLGIIPRSIAHLFANLDNGNNIQLQGMLDYTFEVMFLEIYCEKLRNLLKLTDTPKIRERRIPGTKDDWETYVDGSSWTQVKNHFETMQLINTATKNRTVASTGLNQSSSRSHLVMLVKITMEFGNAKRVGLGSFVDLAGSENIAKSKVQGIALKEAQKIILSLTTLSMVIEKLSDGKGLPPYKDSQLTFLLRNSLGGNCKTTLLIAASPHVYNRNETIRSLEFGKRCRKIKNKAKQNEEMSKSQLIKEIERLTSENNVLQDRIRRGFKGKKGNNSNNTESKDDAFNQTMMDNLNQTKEDNTRLVKEITQLRETIEGLMTKIATLEDTKINLQTNQVKLKGNLDDIMNNNDIIKNKLRERDLEIGGLKKRIDALNEESMNTDKSNKKLKSEHERIKNELNDSQNIINELKNELTSIQEKRKLDEQKLLNSIQSKNNENNELDSMIKQLQNEIENSNNDNDTMKKNIKDMEMKMNDLKNKNNTYQDNIDELNDKYKVTFAKLLQNNNENVQLRQELESLQKQKQELESNIDDIKIQNDETNEQMSVEQENLNNEIKMLREENELLKNRLKSETLDMETQKSKLENENQQLVQVNQQRLELIESERKMREEHEAQVELLKIQANEMSKMYENKVKEQIQSDWKFADHLRKEYNRKKKYLDKKYNTPGGPDSLNDDRLNVINNLDNNDDSDSVHSDDYDDFKNDDEFKNDISYAKTLAFIKKLREEDRKREAEEQAKRELQQIARQNSHNNNNNNNGEYNSDDDIMGDTITKWKHKSTDMGNIQISNDNDTSDDDNE